MTRLAALLRLDLRPDARRSERGFTLLELLVVITILGLLIYLVAPAAFRTLGSAKNKIAAQSIEQLGSILDTYRLDVGTYPSTEQGLPALLGAPSGVSNWQGPYVKGDKVPLDPWSHPFIYRFPSTRQGHDYDLCSQGENGQAGTQTAQICND